MRLILLTSLTMLAFAANSVLTRWAVAPGHASALGFAAIRLVAGAVMLMALVAWRDGVPRWPAEGAGLARIAGVLGLSIYLVGFSMAYRGVDAGTGALVLFGTVQVTMLLGAVALGDAVPGRRWAGAGLSLAGLVLLALSSGPGADAARPAALALGLMVLAGLGWGAFSLAGRGARAPLTETAWNFALALPLVAPIAALDGGPAPDAQGVALAVVAGAVTSGLGYALWYAILPALGSGRAAVAQASVPVLAGLGGALVLADAPAAGFWGAAMLVMAGVVLGSLPARRKP